MPRLRHRGHVEASLLAEALGLDVDLMAARTREPLGSGSVTGFDVTTDGSDLRYYVDTSRHPVEIETGLALGDPAAPEARVWLHPADPHLPALAPAAFGHAAEALLARLGIDARESPSLVAYRPGRRAVLRVATADGAVWIKIVRPSRVERIVELHRSLGDGGVPVPRVRGWSPEGLIVIDDARGLPAPDVEWDPDRLLDAVDALRADIARVPLDAPVQGAARRLAWYLSRLTANDAGDLERRAAPLVARLNDALPLAGRPDSTVHGDLHFGQLFLGPADAVTAVIDVDTAGRGDRGGGRGGLRLPRGRQCAHHGERRGAPAGLEPGRLRIRAVGRRRGRPPADGRAFGGTRARGSRSGRVQRWRRR